MKNNKMFERQLTAARKKYPNEEIKLIPGFFRYAVSNTGRVFSFWDKWKKYKDGFWEQKPSIDRDGYYMVQLKINGKQQFSRVHRLVAFAFLPTPQKTKPNVLHRDDNPHNNHASNLYWGSQKNNEEDKKRNGNAGIGENHSHPKLTEKAVLYIRKAAVLGVKQRTLSIRFDVSEASISNIVKRKSWVHV